MALFQDITFLIYILSVLLILIMIFLERSEPQTIAFWTAVLLIVPLLAFVFPSIGFIFPIAAFMIYLFFGQTFYSKHQFAVKNIDDEKIKGIREDALMNDLVSRREEEFSRTITRSGGSLCTENNDISLYTEGKEFFGSLLEDLRGARSSIHVEMYIVRNDELSNEFMDVLIAKAEEGLEVKLMIDAIGNNSGPIKKIREFKKAGGKFALFHRTISVLLSPKKNNRNHRKIIVIDGETGYVSGFNIGDEYLGKGPFGYWRDSGVRIRGLGVTPLQMRFFADWKYASGKMPEIADGYFPSLDRQYGSEALQIVSGGPDSKSNPIGMQYLKMFSSAKKTLYIHTPYLVPDRSAMDALALAAYSGTDVRIIIPNRPDHMFVYWVTLWYAGELMKRGVRVFRYNRGFVHSKTVVADGKYCSVGSANLDMRSMNLNFETNSMIYSDKIGREMDEAFLEDLKYCDEYTLEEHAKMSTWNNFKVSISRLFSSLA